MTSCRHNPQNNHWPALFRCAARGRSLRAILVALFGLLVVQPAYSHEAFEVDEEVGKASLARPFGPRRTRPIYTGEVLVGVILVKFPDSRDISLKGAEANFRFPTMSVEDYFREYSQGVCWIRSEILGAEKFPNNVYTAPEPVGYYCEYDFWTNPLGFKEKDEGQKRIKELRDAARRQTKGFRIQPGESGGKSKPDITLFMYETRRKKTSQLEAIVGEAYGNREHPHDGRKGAWELCKPKIAWRDPLWPSSYPQVLVSSGAATYAHEIGHRLGAPDFYHAPEKNDGMGGDPVWAVSYGPTGPAYCRYIYNAFLSNKNYPTYSKSGTYTLHKRSTNPAGDKPVGCFVPTRHPHYVFCLEYVSGEKSPLGNPGKQGMLVQVINRTMGDSFLGAPDLCYTYRPNDPWFRSKGSPMYFLKKANGTGTFNQETNPSSRLPNLLESGVSFEILEETDDTVTIKLDIGGTPLTRAQFADSLLPNVHLLKIDQVMSTSFRAELDVRFRGEPLLEEYGICWSETGTPKRVDGSYTPLYHRDTYSARVLGLKPQTTYTVKAYGKSEKGIRYSENELRVTTSHLKAEMKDVPPLLDDNFSGNFFITSWNSRRVSSDGQGSSVGGTASTSLLKLASYYHVSPVTLTGRYGQKSSDRKDGLDFTRIHRRPSESRPDFRLETFEEVNKLCKRAARGGKMLQTVFTDDFDGHFKRLFKLKDSPYPAKPAIESLNRDNVAEIEEALRTSIRLGKPVLIGQQPAYSGSTEYGLHWVVVDGYKANGTFHMDHTDGPDRDRPKIKRKRGWYRLTSLLEDTEGIKVFWGFKPDFGIQYNLHAREALKRKPIDVTRLHPELTKSLFASHEKGVLAEAEFTLSFSAHKVKITKVNADGSVELAANGASRTFALKDFAAVDIARIAFINAQQSGGSLPHALAVAYSEAAGFSDIAKRLSKKANAKDLKKVKTLIED